MLKDNNGTAAKMSLVRSQIHLIWILLIWNTESKQLLYMYMYAFCIVMSDINSFNHDDSFIVIGNTFTFPVHYYSNNVWMSNHYY